MGEIMLQGQNKHATKKRNSNTSAASTVDGLFNTGSFRVMSIFGKKPAKELPPLFSESEIDGATYDQVLDFLVSINDDDFSKVIKVAETYRKTHGEVAEITGLKREAVPSIFDEQKQPPVVAQPDTEAGNFLNDDDDIAAAFLDDDEPTPPTAPKPTDGPVAS